MTLGRRTVLAWGVLAGALAGAAPLANAGAYRDFFLAIELDHDFDVIDLLRRGFDPNARDRHGQPALIVALSGDARKSAAALIAAKGLKVEARNAKDESPLMMAALRGNLDAARALIARDADVNKPGWTPLHYAASGTSADAPAMVALLLEHAAYIDAASPNGTTPLMMALRYGLYDSAALLVKEGADATIKNQLGLTALDFARQTQRDDMEELALRALQRQQPEGGKW